MQHVGIIRAFLSAWRDLLSFSVPRGQKKLLGCALLGGPVPWLTLCVSFEASPYGKPKKYRELLPYIFNLKNGSKISIQERARCFLQVIVLIMELTSY